jgi:hypothetical protein
MIEAQELEHGCKHVIGIDLFPNRLQTDVIRCAKRRAGLDPAAAEIALTQQFRSAVVNLINHVFDFMSVIKNNGCACSFCNSDSGDGAAHRRRRREASRCKT